MKKMHFTYILAVLFLWSSCKKTDFPPGANEKQFMIKKLIHGTKEYNFYFSKKRLLDSVVRLDTKEVIMYRIVRSGERIDSVIYTFNHNPIYAITDIAYDGAGNIIFFNNVPLSGPSLTQPREITYLNGHVHSITRHNLFLSFLTTRDTLTYNSFNNITRWATAMPRSTDVDVKLYTYDNRYNPLYFIEELLVVFSEGEFFLAEFFLSQHNNTSKFHQLFNQTVNYENIYDNKGRIIKKRFTNRDGTVPDSLIYQYVR